MLLGSYGINLSFFDKSEGMSLDPLEGLAGLNNPVYGLVEFNGEIILGGSFTKSSERSALFLAQLTGYSDVSSIRQDNPSIYPNPFHNVIRISKYDSQTQYTVYEANGSKIREGMVTNNGSMNLENLSPGVYILYVKSGNTFSVHKLIKN